MSTHDQSRERDELQRILDELVADGTIVNTGRTRRAPDGTEQPVYIHSDRSTEEEPNVKSNAKVIRIKYLDDMNVKELRALADEIERHGRLQADSDSMGPEANDHFARRSRAARTDPISDAEVVRDYADKLLVYLRSMKSYQPIKDRRAMNALLKNRAHVLEILHWHCVGVPQN